MALYNSRRSLTKDEVFLLLYMNDGALIFTNRSDAILGSKIAFTQMERMGMNMHVGKGEKISKTEGMFFSSRETMQIWIEDSKTFHFLLQPYQSCILILQKKNLPIEKMKIILNRCYDESG